MNSRENAPQTYEQVKRLECIQAGTVEYALIIGSYKNWGSASSWFSKNALPAFFLRECNLVNSLFPIPSFQRLRNGFGENL